MADQLEGVEVKVGRRVFVVPPLTVWAQEQLEALVMPEDPKAQKEALFGQMVLLLEGNYPGLTGEELKKLIPMRQLGDVVQAVAKAAAAGLGAPGEAPRP
jgi:hypothetical protein